MTDKERIAEILKKYTKRHGIMDSVVILEEYAEELVNNGVIVPPCKVGDTVWDLHQRYNGTFVIQEGKISMLTQKADKSWHLRITVNSSVWGFTPNEIGTRYFLTKEEAEAKLRGLVK